METQLGLPPCTWEDRSVPLSPLERHIYEGEQGKLLRAFEKLGGSSARDEGASKQVGGGAGRAVERLGELSSHSLRSGSSTVGYSPAARL